MYCADAVAPESTSAVAARITDRIMLASIAVAVSTIVDTHAQPRTA
jgi:hypothetical protein